jgi:hypothetical protein
MQAMDYTDPELMKRLSRATGRPILFSWAILETISASQQEACVKSIEEMKGRPRTNIECKRPEWSGPWPGGPKNSEFGNEFDSPPKST